jgi:hypothetical protein
MLETLLEFLTAWGTSCGEAGFIAYFDFDGDCLIDTDDLLHLLQDFATPSAPETSPAVKA